MVCSYLLIWQVGPTLTSNLVEVSIHSGNTMAHGPLKDASIDKMSGSYPLQLQGRPTCPGGQGAHTQEGMIASQANSASNQRGSRDKAESWGKSQSQEAPPEKEAEDGGQPLVIDKTKEYKWVSTQYIKYLV